MKAIHTFLISLAGVVAVTLVISAQTAESAPPAADNLLRNADFEAGFYAWGGDQARNVPDEWAGFFDSGLAQPRYNAAEDPRRVQSGKRAASYWEQQRDYDAGIYQIVPNVTKGTVYRFAAYGHAWSTTDTGKQTSDTDVQMRIGIDPKGGDNPNAASIVWSGTVSAKDTFQLFSVDATADGTQITVWLRGKTTYPVKQTDMYWDNTSLIVVGQAPAQPTNTPKPGGGGGNTGGGGAGGGCSNNSVPAGSIVPATPQPDGSIIHTVKPCESLTGIAVTYGITLEQIRSWNNLKTDVIQPGQQLIVKQAGGGGGNSGGDDDDEPTEEPEATEETPVVTPSPLPTVVAEQPDASTPGTICIMAYEDSNTNGLREPTEPKQADITFVVSDGAQAVGTYTTDGLSEPHCFDGLPAGTYTVSWTGGSFLPSGDQTWIANLSPGATVNRDFGVLPGADGAEQGGGARPPAGSGGGLLPTWAAALVGALGAIFLLVGGSSLGYFLLLRRSQI